MPVLPGEEIVTLSAETVERLFDLYDDAAVRLYLYILRLRGPLDRAKAAKRLDVSPGQLSRAFEALCKVGLVSSPESSVSVTEEPPQRETAPPPTTYCAEDIAKAIECDGGFAWLLSSAEAWLGKAFNQNDTSSLLRLYSYLGLSPEVIAILIKYCIHREQCKKGPGRLPTMRAVEREGYAWERAGVDNAAKADKYVASRKELDGDSAKVKKLLKIEDRAVSKTEEGYISAWLSAGFSPDAIYLAYDRTVINTGKLKWNYMDSILRRWKERGLLTPEDIERQDTRYASKAAPATPSASKTEKTRGQFVQSEFEKRYIEEVKRQIESGGGDK